MTTHGTQTGRRVPGEGAAQQAIADGGDDARTGGATETPTGEATLAPLAALSGMSGLRRQFGSARTEPKRSKRAESRS